MSGDTHLGFIVAAYSVTVLCIGGTIVALWLDNRAQKRLLARFSDRRDDAE